MHPERLIMEINFVQNYISVNFHSDYKAVRSHLNFWASLGLPGHRRGPLYRVAQGIDLPKVASIGYVFYTPMRM